MSFLTGRAAAWTGGILIGGLLVVFGHAVLTRDDNPAQQGGVTVHVSAAGCVANVCTMLAVPQVTVTASLNGTVIATGQTGRDGSVFLPAPKGGRLQINGKSPFLRDGQFSSHTTIIQPGKYGDLIVTVPISDEIRSR